MSFLSCDIRISCFAVYNYSLICEYMTPVYKVKR